MRNALKYVNDTATLEYTSRVQPVPVPMHGGSPLNLQINVTEKPASSSMLNIDEGRSSSLVEKHEQNSSPSTVARDYFTHLKMGTKKRKNAMETKHRSSLNHILNIPTKKMLYSSVPAHH